MLNYREIRNQNPSYCTIIFSVLSPLKKKNLIRKMSSDSANYKLQVCMVYIRAEPV